jgi:hypothetical protein
VQIRLLHFLGQGEYEAECSGDMIPLVTEHGIGETVLFDSLFRMFDRLG